MSPDSYLGRVATIWKILEYHFFSLACPTLLVLECYNSAVVRSLYNVRINADKKSCGLLQK